MTDDKIALCALPEKSSDTSMPREMISFAAERLMTLETEALCGAAPGERSAERINQRNGYTTWSKPPSYGLDPEACLRHVLERIADHPVSRVGDLLLWNTTGIHPRLDQRIAA